jgi:16S rRNA (uracil1498-N3)-methyltransferase
MTRRRWIADEYTPQTAVLTGANAAHLARTLRARIGQEFDVACGERVYRARVSSVADDRVEFTLGEEVVASTAVVPITLLLAIFKFDRMEWAIEKCTELNVSNIVPVIARRTEKHLAQATEKRVERWRRIALEAAQQSRRIAPPEIADPAKLSDALVCDAKQKIVLAENETGVTLSELLRTQSDAGSLALAIGPEGGWAEDELQAFDRAGWVAASLGETILRAETAAIAAVAIARAELPWFSSTFPQKSV